MKDLIRRAETLIEALPYIQAFSGKTVVVKYGGHAMQDPALEDDFARDIVLLATVGIHPIVIHGGGPQIGQVLTQLGIETRFHEGLRVTDERTMDVVEMVLMGLVNGNIVRRINRFGGNAVGLAGKDGNLIRARKMHLRLADNQSDEVDLGQVGEVEEIKPGILTTLISQGFIPVVAPVGQGENGKALNLNADHVAGRIAEALGAEKLILLTDVDGVMDSEKQLLSSLSVAEAEELISEGTIQGGMIPKIRCVIDAVKNGVEKTHIINGTLPHAVLLEVFTKGGVGTEVVKEKR
ncbi:MAG: acetylglutamate kinase [Deltaproteobacteria bacterium]|nr:acetylglutamate kinase [Deltaproteobacteria bacterium]